MSLEIFTSKGNVKFLSQEAYLRNLAHSSFDGIRASVYTKNQQITIAPQLRVLQQGEAPAQLGQVTYNIILSLADVKFPTVRREGFDEGWELVLNLPKLVESWFLEGFGATSESDSGRWVYVGHTAGHLSEDFVDRKDSMSHGDGGGGNLCQSTLRRSQTRLGLSKKAPDGSPTPLKISLHPQSGW